MSADTALTGVDAEAFRSALSRLAAGVAVVTTVDADDRPQGFTASSFCSVSLEPPLVLVCLATSANSYPAFSSSPYFAVSVLHDGQAELAARFATKSGDKFARGGFDLTPDGLPVAEEALAVLRCAVHDRYLAGDHLILVGLVLDTRPGTGRPLVYAERAFRRLAEREDTP